MQTSDTSMLLSNHIQIVMITTNEIACRNLDRGILVFLKYDYRNYNNVVPIYNAYIIYIIYMYYILYLY